MDFRYKEWKRAVRQFLRTAYPDERLVWLLAHTRGEQLSYQSCCCLIGVTTADHPLRGRVDLDQTTQPHYSLAKKYMGAREAEQAFWELGFKGPERVCESSDPLRRRRLLPMILSELRRREMARTVSREMASIPGELVARRG